MKQKPLLLILFSLFLSLSSILHADVPQMIHYQGHITVDGEPYDGTGYFKFAIVDDGTENIRTAEATAVVTNGFITSVEIDDPGSGYEVAPAITFSGGSGSGAEAEAIVENGEVVQIEVTNPGSGYHQEAPDVSIGNPPAATIQRLWANDSNFVETGVSEPIDSLSIEVKSGIFSVLLGDDSIENMLSLSAKVFSGSTTFLRIWFSEDGNDFEQLIPDQPIASVPYAHRAENINITTSTQIANGIIAARHLNIDNFKSGASSNSVSGFYSFVGGGENNRASSSRSFVGGGRFNSADSSYSFVGGGENNTAAGLRSFVGGGENNTASGSYSFVGGGQSNSASASHSFVGGGQSNFASGSRSFVGGGRFNSADSSYSFVGGGENNTAAGLRSFVGGGEYNTASGSRSFVGGGEFNTADGVNSFVGGGYRNIASGGNSFAAGRWAKAEHDGTFVWGDNTNNDFKSTAQNQFLIQATGGVGINTNNPDKTLPDMALHVMGHTAIGRINSGLDYRLGVGTSNPWNTLHVVSEPEQGPFRVAIGDNNTVAMRIYPHRGTAIGASWGDADVPARGLRVYGNAVKTGGGSWSSASDRRLKQNIEPLKVGTLDQLLKLQSYTYEFTEEAIENELALPGKQTGFIAQEVAEVFPDWVSENSDGFLYLTERGTTAILVAALRELRNEKTKEVEDLKSENVQIRKENNQLRSEISTLRNELKLANDANDELDQRLARIEALLDGEKVASR